MSASADFNSLPAALGVAALDCAGDYVTGMTEVGRPDAGAECPPIIWLVEPYTDAKSRN
jgi:hypothetical protein